MTDETGNFLVINDLRPAVRVKLGTGGYWIIDIENESDKTDIVDEKKGGWIVDMDEETNF